MDKAIEGAARQATASILNPEAEAITFDHTQSPYGQKLVEETRKFIQDPGQKDPLDGLRRRERIPSFNETKVQETVEAQLGDFPVTEWKTKGETEGLQITDRTAEADKEKLRVRRERVSAIATTIAAIKTPEDFDRFMQDTTKAGNANIFLDEMIVHLSDIYPAYKDHFKGKSEEEKRILMKACFRRQEFIDKIRVRLDGTLKQDTALQLHKEKEKHSKDLVHNIDRLEEVIDIIGRTFSTTVDKDTLEKMKGALHDSDVDLSFVSSFMQNYTAYGFSRDTVDKIKEAFRHLNWDNQKTAQSQERVYSAYTREVSQKNEELVANFNRTIVLAVQEIQSKRGIIKDLDKRINERRDMFERSMLDIGGSVMADYIDARVAEAGTRIKRMGPEAVTADEKLIGEMLKEVDGAWKHVSENSRGLRTETIDRAKVRAAFKILVGDSANLRGVMEYVLANPEVPPAQRAAMRRLVVNNPQDEKVKQMLTSTAALIVRDYVQTGGKLDEKTLELIGSSKEQSWLKGIIVQGLQFTPDAERSISDIYGNEVTKILKQEQWPKIWEWMKEHIGLKGLLMILLMALGLWSAVHFLPGVIGGIQAAIGSKIAAAGAALNIPIPPELITTSTTAGVVPGGAAAAAGAVVTGLQVGLPEDLKEPITRIAATPIALPADTGAGTYIGGPLPEGVSTFAPETPVPGTPTPPIFPRMGPATTPTPAPSPIPGPPKQ